MDVHYRVDGLTASALAEAHHRDLQSQERHGVRFRSYWFDESTGKVFCLAEAPSGKAMDDCHREAHGILADEIVSVSEYGLDHGGTGAISLCMDQHFRFEGLTPERIAETIEFHTEAGSKHGVRWLKAWYDAGSGRLFCLSESPNPDAHTAVHDEAGILVDEVVQVSEGL